MNEAARHIAFVIEWLKRPDWGQYQYMEGSEIYTHRDDALIDLNCATAAIEAAETAAFRRGWEAARAQIFAYITDMEVPASGGDDYRAGWSDGAAEVQADIAALPPPEDKP